MKLMELFEHWTEVRSGLVRAAQLFRPDELSYSPFPGARSVAETLLHIANAEEGWFRYAVTKERAEWPEAPAAKDYPSPEAVLSLLSTVHGETLAYLAPLDADEFHHTVRTPWGEELALGQVIWHVIDHEIHHRGELSLILGLLGRDGLQV